MRPTMRVCRRLREGFYPARSALVIQRPLWIDERVSGGVALMIGVRVPDHALCPRIA